MTERDLQVLVGQAIRTRRLALGISQDKFAEKLGMHRSYYGHLERGRWNITVQTLVRVAEGLGVTAASLLQDADI